VSGGGQPSSSSNTTSLPKWLQPYAQAFMGSYFNQVYGGPQSFTPSSGGKGGKGGKGGAPVMLGAGAPTPVGMPSNLNQQVAGFTPDQLAAMDAIRNQTGAAQGLADTGIGMATDTLSGKFLDPTTNPWLSKTYDAASQNMVNKYQLSTAPSTMAAMQRAGQFGGSAMNESMALDQFSLGQNLSNLATSIYGGNYATERGNQMQMQGMMPSIMGAGYYPGQQLMGVGALEQEQQQAVNDTGYQNAVGQAEWPYNILSGMGGALGQAGGGTGSSKTSMSQPGGGMMGMSVICTEETYAADTKFGASLPAEVIAGYHRWGIPVAHAMRRSRLVTMLVAPLALVWAKEMRAHIEGRDRRPGFGTLLLVIGVPICAWLGRRNLKEVMA
jgi:hypothetical protein